MDVQQIDVAGIGDLQRHVVLLELLIIRVEGLDPGSVRQTQILAGLDAEAAGHAADDRRGRVHVCGVGRWDAGVDADLAEGGALAVEAVAIWDVDAARGHITHRERVVIRLEQRVRIAAGVHRRDLSEGVVVSRPAGALVLELRVELLIGGLEARDGDVELDGVSVDRPVPHEVRAGPWSRADKEGLPQRHVRRAAAAELVQDDGDVRGANVWVVLAGVSGAVEERADRGRRLPRQIVDYRVVPGGVDRVVIPIESRIAAAGDRVRLGPDALRDDTQGAAVEEVHRVGSGRAAEALFVQAVPGPERPERRQAGRQGLHVVAGGIMGDQTGGRDHDIGRRVRVECRAGLARTSRVNASAAAGA